MFAKTGTGWMLKIDPHIARGVDKAEDIGMSQKKTVGPVLLCETTDLIIPGHASSISLKTYAF